MKLLEGSLEVGWVSSVADPTLVRYAARMMSGALCYHGVGIRRGLAVEGRSKREQKVRRELFFPSLFHFFLRCASQPIGIDCCRTKERTEGKTDEFSERINFQPPFPHSCEAHRTR